MILLPGNGVSMDHQMGFNRATPKDIAITIRSLQEGRSKSGPPVSFLIGSGFSFSAGIPTAEGIIQQIRQHPAVQGIPPCPNNQSEYAYLMSQLPPFERTRVIRDAVKSAFLGNTNRTKVNWAHLLLAALCEREYVNLVLTTNFDPLIVDALALMGQPVRAYDLAASERFLPGILQPGSVVYLHGQASGILMCNSEAELARIRKALRPVLDDAVRNSTLIVVGYSGDADPVFDELCASFPQFPARLYWVHYHPSNPLPSPSVMRLIEDRTREAFLVTSLDADAFMVRLVVEELKIAVPKVIQDPLKNLKQTLERVGPFPTREGPSVPDPLLEARRVVEDAIQRVYSPTLLAKQGAGEAVEPKAPDDRMALVGAIKAAMTGDRRALEGIALRPMEAMSPALRETLGDGFLRLASPMVDEDPQEALVLLDRAAVFGASNRAWIPALRGLSLARQAERAVDLPRKEVAERFRQAARECAEAARINPQMHEAYNNWGNTLAAWARIEEGAEADRLCAEAADKYAASLRIEPKKNSAFYNWGNLLKFMARTKKGSEADRLYAGAAEKYAAAVQAAPDEHAALYNWGNMLTDWAATKNGAEADRLYSEAGDKYAAVVRITPDMREAHNNWGSMLAAWARTKVGPEADRLFREAAEKHAAAVRVDPAMHEAYNNWGIMLDIWAGTKEGPEADRLYMEAAEKYAAALSIKSDDRNALCNWGNMLAVQARAAKGADASRLVREAAEKLDAAARMAPDDPLIAYNLACLHALQGDLDGCLVALGRWSEFDKSACRETIDQDPDFDKVRDAARFVEFLRNLPPSERR